MIKSIDPDDPQLLGLLDSPVPEAFDLFLDLDLSTCVAEKRPVRRCLGKKAKIWLRAVSNPMESSRSASSRINTSNAFTLAERLQSFFCSRSLSRPGVETRMLPPFEFNSSLADDGQKREKISKIC